MGKKGETIKELRDQIRYWRSEAYKHEGMLDRLEKMIAKYAQYFRDAR